MKNAHITFIGAPVASILNPVLPIVSVLMRRGHRVTHAMSDPFASRVAVLGAEVIRFPFGALTARAVEQDENAYFRLATNTLAAVTPFYEENRPDLFVYDALALAGPILAHKWRIPAIRTSADYAFSRTALDWQIPDPQRRTDFLELNERADRFLKQHGVGIRGHFFHREKLNIYTMPRDFEPYADALDETCFYAGRCAGEQVAFGDWRRRNKDGRPIVLVATSKSYARGSDYFRMCVAAFSDLPWHVILSIDDDADAAALSPLPSNFEIVQRTSHTRILPHASLLVFMAGTAAANEAAYHGVPWVATTLGISELEWLGDMLAKLGVGVHIKGAGVSSPVVRRAALEVLESTAIRDRTKEFQRMVQHDAGAEEAANRIEEYLDNL